MGILRSTPKSGFAGRELWRHAGLTEDTATIVRSTGLRRRVGQRRASTLGCVDEGSEEVETSRARPSVTRLYRAAIPRPRQDWQRSGTCFSIERVPSKPRGLTCRQWWGRACPRTGEQGAHRAPARDQTGPSRPPLCLHSHKPRGVRQSIRHTRALRERTREKATPGFLSPPPQYVPYESEKVCSKR